MTGYYDDKRRIESFIDKHLRTKLEKDQKSLKILSEGDLQSAVYYHIRKFFEKSKVSENWYITNKLPVGGKKDSKKIPDIAILYSRPKGDPYIPFLIELKEDHTFKPERILHDLKKLENFVKKYRKNLEQTYFIYSVLDKENDSKKICREIEKMNSSNQKGWHISIIVNILGKKQRLRDIETLEKNYLKLRKFRNYHK